MSVWRGDATWYEGRKDGHTELWQFVERFVRENGITSMLEVGGGHGYASEMVEQYCGVELNSDAVLAGHNRYPHATFIEGDFCNMELTGLIGQYDLVLACAVAEHLPSYKPLIIGALEVKPRFAIVSFFRGLDRPQDRINRMESQDTEWSEAGGVYWDNAYAKSPLTDWLTGLSAEWRLKRIGSDAVLIVAGRPV
jgi:hypothetical protein